MKEAKVYKGMKVKLWNGETKNVPYTSFEAYEKFTQDTYGQEMLNKEPELFLCGLFNDNNLNKLYDFREELSNEKGYNCLLNKKEIEEKLEKGYFVAVKGVGEVSSIDELVNVQKF